MSYVLEFTKIAQADIEKHKKAGDKVVLKKIAKLLNELKESPTEGTVGYTTDGNPLTKQQYNERLLVAEKQIESGSYTTQEDLEKEIENW